MGNNFGFLVIIIGKNCYRVNIGDIIWAFFDTYDPCPYDKTVIMAVSTTATSVQCSPLETYHIRKLKNFDQLLGGNRSSWDLITGAMNRHLIASIFDNVIGYKEHSSINIIMLLRDCMCLNFDNSKN